MFDSAESLLPASHNVWAAHTGPQRPDTLETRSVLVDLYEAWNRPQQAAAFRPQEQPAESG